MSAPVPLEFADDPTGDQLDALLCSIQAAGAWTLRNEGFGAPNPCDATEGWIADPDVRADPDSGLSDLFAFPALNAKAHQIADRLSSGRHFPSGLKNAGETPLSSPLPKGGRVPILPLPNKGLIPISPLTKGRRTPISPLTKGGLRGVAPWSCSTIRS